MFQERGGGNYQRGRALLESVQGRSIQCGGCDNDSKREKGLKEHIRVVMGAGGRK